MLSTERHSSYLLYYCTRPTAEKTPSRAAEIEINKTIWRRLERVVQISCRLRRGRDRAEERWQSSTEKVITCLGHRVWSVYDGVSLGLPAASAAV